MWDDDDVPPHSSQVEKAIRHRSITNCPSRRDSATPLQSNQGESIS